MSPLMAAWRSRTTDVAARPPKIGWVSVREAWQQMGMPKPDGIFAAIAMVLVFIWATSFVSSCAGVVSPVVRKRLGTSKVPLTPGKGQLIFWVFLDNFLPT